MYHSIQKIPVCIHHRLDAGPRHGVPVEVAHHLLDLHHKGDDSVVGGGG
jgi:hypothetical protein